MTMIAQSPQSPRFESWLDHRNEDNNSHELSGRKEQSRNKCGTPSTIDDFVGEICAETVGLGAQDIRYMGQKSAQYPDRQQATNDTSLNLPSSQKSTKWLLKRGAMWLPSRSDCLSQSCQRFTLQDILPYLCGTLPRPGAPTRTCCAGWGGNLRTRIATDTVFPTGAGFWRLYVTSESV